MYAQFDSKQLNSAQPHSISLKASFAGSASPPGIMNRLVSSQIAWYQRGASALKCPSGRPPGRDAAGGLLWYSIALSLSIYIYISLLFYHCYYCYYHCDSGAWQAVQLLDALQIAGKADEACKHLATSLETVPREKA